MRFNRPSDAARAILSDMGQHLKADVVVHTGSDHGKQPEPIVIKQDLPILQAVQEMELYNAGVRDGGWSWAVVELSMRPTRCNWRIRLKCETGHVQDVIFENVEEEIARDYAQVLDGSSPMFVHPPHPDSKMHKCGACGKPFTCEVTRA